KHLATEIGEKELLGGLFFLPGSKSEVMIRADAHDLDACGLELRQGRLEAVQFFRSGRSEGRNERIDHDRALGRQIGELDRLAVNPVQRELGGLLPYFDGARGAR